jgi:hypothetical protein
MDSWLTEYRRPWKLATRAMGLVLLMLDSAHCRAADCDIPITFIIAILACRTAP